MRIDRSASQPLSLMDMAVSILRKPVIWCKDGADRVAFYDLMRMRVSLNRSASGRRWLWEVYLRDDLLSACTADDIETAKRNATKRARELAS